MFAGSGNVWSALPIIERDGPPLVAAAVLYYGAADGITTFRRDIPLLFVRAGLDRPGVNDAMGALVGTALSQNAPVTILNHPAGYHGFEIRNDDDVTRAVMDQTIAFVSRVTDAGYQAALRAGQLEAGAAADMATGHPGRAAEAYAGLVASRPGRTDAAPGRTARHSSPTQQFGAACDEFEKLRGKGLGPRDLGLPAASACLQRGDPERAVGWLRAIPRQYLPDGVKDDPRFAALRDRPDFRALFGPS